MLDLKDGEVKDIYVNGERYRVASNGNTVDVSGGSRHKYNPEEDKIPETPADRDYVKWRKSERGIKFTKDLEKKNKISMFWFILIIAAIVIGFPLFFMLIGMLASK